ncbi:MAG: HAMP domain-containing histidine kinase [Candidatus Nealsonbacteria bacterium]|nr:HAMP domain-containing histidine kinase [Candidatus Nealsonbacteria bacterium]
MGIVISGSAFTTYALGTRYFVVEPTTVSLIVLVVTGVLLIITFSIVRSMEGLAEASRLKSEFISIVSHQLRSPLSNLRWAAEVLVSKDFGELAPKQKEYLKIIQENNGRMGELVTDLLMVSRIDEGKLLFDKIKFSLEDLAKEVINGLKVLAEASNVAINLEVSEILPQVCSDYKMIKIVVENLLDNAIRYIKEKGKVFIKINNKNDHLLFEIRDTGVGIPKDDQRHIFQKFFRSQNILRQQTLGSGLGLHITKSIIEKSGGKIWFKSQEGVGSTFWFTLPIK